MKKVANKCFPRELKKAKKPFKLYTLSKMLSLQIGELLYCKNRGMTRCCFVDEECGADMVEVKFMI